MIPNPFDIFRPLLLDPLTNTILALYRLVDSVGLPGQLGFAIILLTVVVRLIVYPFYSAQMKHQKKMADLKPHLDELKRRYGHDRKRHQEEQMKLYRDRGFNPAGGCLPSLVQVFLLAGFYYALAPIFSQSVDAARDHLNAVAYFPWLKLTSLNLDFFGLNLAHAPNSGLLLAIPIVTGLLQLILTKMTQPPPAAKPALAGASFTDALAQSQSTMLYILPVMIGYFTFVLPAGLALYWNTTTIFAIIQQYFISGPGGLSSWLPKRLIPRK